MKLDTLYTLDSKGKVRVFECEVNTGMIPNKKESVSASTEYDNVHIITRTGLLGGKLIKKVELVKQGKQKRNTFQQAVNQAKALWEDKLDSGYKTLSQLDQKMGTTVYSDTQAMTLKLAIERIPEFALTNSNWDYLPMLAHKFKDIKNPQYPYFAQPKLNGVRMMAKYENTMAPNPIKLCSRGGQYYIVPHISDELESIFSKLEDRRIIFDGELYKHGVPLQDISGAARKEVSNNMFASNNWLEYHIYDVIDLNKLDLEQKDRTLLLNQITFLVDKNKYIKFVPTIIVNDKEQVQINHDFYIEQGYEGLILRSPNSKYEFNQRSKGLLKVKMYQDEEFTIIGSGYDDNKSLGESFYFELQNNINESTFKSRPTGSISDKVKWATNIEDIIGKKATVRFFERSKDGIPQQNCVQSKLTEVLHIRPNGE